VVRISGQEVGAMSDGGRTRLRKTTVSFVFQKFNLLPNLSAGDNIALARYLAGKNHAGDKDEAARFQEVLRLLDSVNSRAVLEILRDLNQRLGQTILMITHNPDAAAFGHRIVHMQDGRIVAAPPAQYSPRHLESTQL
jgi:putative ABC transport system ATP-binding protein